MNLLKETQEAIAMLGKMPEDVCCVATQKDDKFCTWKEFLELANVNYDNGYGGAEIREDLIILFHDGSWLERAEYDGSEWWEHKCKPHINGNGGKLVNVKAGL